MSGHWHSGRMAGTRIRGRIAAAVRPRWTSRGGFLVLVLHVWIFLAAGAAAVLYITITATIDDPTEPAEWAGLITFWWPMLAVGDGAGILLSALWWILLAWCIALAIDRGRGWYHGMQRAEDEAPSSP